MWLSRSLIFLSVAFSSSFARAFELEPRQHDGLSTCAQSCHDFLLPMFDCDSTTKLCFCVEASLTAVIDACVASNCTYAEQLESREFQATACEIPRRNQSGTLNTLSWTMFSFATLFFLLRLASLLVAREGLHSSDWTFLACYLCLVGATLCIHLSAKNGLGQDSWYFSVDQISDFLRIFYAFTILEHTILLLAKLILVSTYLRILPHQSLSTAYRSICWTFIILLLVTYLATQLATILQCTPISSSWTFILQRGQQQEGKCLDMYTLVRASSALNLVYDMILLFLPIPVLLVASKRLDAVQKFGVYGAYVVGTGIIICSIGRLVVVPPSSSTMAANATSPTTLNMTWTLAQPTLWTTLQLNLSVILICIPGLHPLASLFYYDNRKSSGASLFSSTSSAREMLDAEKEEAGHQRSRRASTRRPGTMTSSFSSTTHGGGGFDFEGPSGPWSRGGGGGAEEEEVMSSSPALHVGLGEGSVTLQHGIPTAGRPTRDRFVYRDGGGRMHEVEVVDRPASGSGEEGEKRRGEEGG